MATVSFWVHTCSTESKPLSGRGYPESLGEAHLGTYFPSAKITVWASLEDVLALVKRKFKNEPYRVINDNRVELVLEADALRPKRTLSWTLVEIPA